MALEWRQSFNPSMGDRPVDLLLILVCFLVVTSNVQRRQPFMAHILSYNHANRPQPQTRCNVFQQFSKTINPMIDLMEIITHQTNGINCDITTEDVIEKLTQWDNLYGIEISEVENDRVVVKFSRLPDNLDDLAAEIYEFCPDVIDQGYGCMDDMLTMGSDADMKLNEEIKALIQDVDFNDENFGLKILKNDLKLSQTVFLWWD